MNETGENQADSGRFGLSCRWCAYSWTALILGLLVTKPMIPSAGTIGPVLILAGIVFSLIAFSLSAIGLVMGSHQRMRFLIPLAVSAPPLAFQLWTML